MSYVPDPSPSRFGGAAALLCGAALTLAACGGGGGGGVATSGSGQGAGAGTPAPGVYRDAAVPDLVAAVSHVSSGSTAWNAWRSSGAGDASYAGSVEINSAVSSVLYFDANGRQQGTADLRTSTTSALKGTAMSGAILLSLNTTPVDPSRLLRLDQLDGTWQGAWRHGSDFATQSITWAAGVSGARVFSPSQLTILNCLVTAAVTEQLSGSPGLFNVQLTLVHAGVSSNCTRVGTYSGVLVAFRDAATRPQLRMLATHNSLPLAISFVAQAPVP